MKAWSEVLELWSNGEYPKLPKNIKKPFIWRTSVINQSIDLPYYEEFIEDRRLRGRKQDYSLFTKPPASLLSPKHKNKYAINTKNLNGDTMQVIPKPRKNKEFTNLFYFMKNADDKQQQELWKLVVKQIKKMLKKNENIWVSSPGLAINYLHIRICSYPKYYEKSKLQNLPKVLTSYKKNKSLKGGSHINFKWKKSSKKNNTISYNSLKKKRKTKLYKKYEKDKLMVIDTTGIIAGPYVKTKNNGLKLAKENKMKFLMLCDYVEFDRLYDVNTKKEIKKETNLYNKYFKLSRLSC